MGRRGADHDVGIEKTALFEMQFVAAALSDDPLDPFPHSDLAVKGLHSHIGQFLNPPVEGGQYTAGSGSTGHRLAGLALGFLLLGELDHRLDQAAVLLFEFVDPRKTAFEAHILGITGEYA